MKKPCRKSGKIKFDSHEQAAIRAGEILNKPGNSAPALWTYRCQFCDKWHLTSSAPVDSPKFLNSGTTANNLKNL